MVWNHTWVIPHPAAHAPVQLPFLAAVGAHDADEREDLAGHAVGLGQGVLLVLRGRVYVMWI